MNEYTSFMISRETENVRSAKEVEDAFRAITDGGKQVYVTEEELYQVLIFICNSFVMTYVGVKCLTRHCSVLRDTLSRGTT